MYNNFITRSIAAALLSLTALASVWGHTFTKSLLAQNSEPVKTLTGTVSDSRCKGWGHPKNQPVSCTRECVQEEGASYVLVVGDRVYILEGRRSELDELAGGRATVTGRFSGNAFLVNSVTTAQE